MMHQAWVRSYRAALALMLVLLFGWASLAHAGGRGIGHGFHGARGGGSHGGIRGQSGGRFHGHGHHGFRGHHGLKHHDSGLHRHHKFTGRPSSASHRSSCGRLASSHRSTSSLGATGITVPAQAPTTRTWRLVRSPGSPFPHVRELDGSARARDATGENRAAPTGQASGQSALPEGCILDLRTRAAPVAAVLWYYWPAWGFYRRRRAITRPEKLPSWDLVFPPYGPPRGPHLTTFRCELG
jgi:hypothetical protein